MDSTRIQEGKTDSDRMQNEFLSNAKWILIEYEMDFEVSR